MSNVVFAQLPAEAPPPARFEHAITLTPFWEEYCRRESMLLRSAWRRSPTADPEIIGRHPRWACPPHSFPPPKSGPRPDSMKGILSAVKAIKLDI